jgi:hypothetical protein
MLYGRGYRATIIIKGNRRDFDCLATHCHPLGNNKKSEAGPFDIIGDITDAWALRSRSGNRKAPKCHALRFAARM